MRSSHWIGFLAERPGQGRRKQRQLRQPNRQPGGGVGEGEWGTDEDEKMDLLFGLLWLLTSFLQGVHSQGVYAPPTVRIVHAGQACNVKEEQHSERVYVIREGETLELQCLVTGHPRPQMRWTKTSGGASDNQGKLSLKGETLKIENISRQQGGRYYCKAENGLGFPAIRSIRVDVYYLDKPVITVHQSDDEAKEQFYFERTVFLRCAANSNPPVHYTWTRDKEVLAEGSDSGVEIYKPFFTQGQTKILKLKNLRLQDYADYTCFASVKNSCGIRDRSTHFILNNKTGLHKGRFWITPDPYHNEDNIQIGREVKISCQVEATPSDELQFSWLKNGRPLKSSERMVITHTDPNISPGTTNLDIIDLKFTDFGTYTCVASLRNGGIPEISIDVNISSTTVPPELSVPKGQSRLIVLEGDTVDLQCLVSGKPKPIIMWSRVEESGQIAALAPVMPDGSAEMESYDGILRIYNVTRKMSGAYRCQTSQYNGFNVKPREALIHLVVQFTPTVKPVYTEVRQALGRPFTLTCNLLQAYPAHHLQYEWKLGSRLLTVGQFSDQSHDTSYHVKALNREGYGEYTCNITNEAGAGWCTFLLTGKAYRPEFYHDTFNALWENRPQVYGFKLQWTQMEPNSVDRIMAYRLGIRQMDQTRWWEQEIPIGGPIQKGQLLTYNLTELIKPESYLVRLTPITRYGEGDASERTITYSAPVNPHLREFHCSFEEEALCSFSQDKSDEFDWIRQSGTKEGTTYTPNTGPSSDHTGSSPGFYMFIETSRPGLEGDKARLMSPIFNINTKSVSSSSASNNPIYCFTFFYHMFGKHIGALNIFLRLKGQMLTDALVWSLTGNQGNYWQQARVNIHPTTTFQVVMEGVRGSGIEGNIAIDDVTIEEGECKDSPSNNLKSLASLPSYYVSLLYISQSLLLIGWQR
ncbi:MAM domain-containing glycosylphosphatidylinositol anchor protein 2-like isoform X3 [Poeciliopsis prolifica]|uniref:MAM domain-containing glycosylphosphatidylinositol anchor protein 2-like isoform X3 n=1 Tax=Poeciliopsis prolifica TaxID=188132 RepID=UPI00241449B8|nr:MAM domain-containing glycosylphosphatidylinositol anchor protein 2-like isoform X3 [Poeciliopsis prolifica]